MREDLEKAIDEKIKDMNRLRYNRIYASERLKGYQDSWEIIFFWMNVIAVIGLVLSNSSHKTSSIYDILTNVYTIYVLLLQYYINGKNYQERSLRFHYQELEVEKFIVELKHLKRKCTEDNTIELENDKQFINIIEKYLIEIRNTENHCSIDDEKRKYTINNLPTNLLEYKSMDKMLIVFNRIIALIYFIYIGLHIFNSGMILGIYF